MKQKHNSKPKNVQAILHGRITRLSLVVFLLSVTILAQAQLSINLGPHLSAGARAKQDGLAAGVGAEAQQSIFKFGAIRLYTAYSQFPTTTIDRVRFAAVRGGYQQYFFSKLFAMGDVGVGRLFYPGYAYSRLSYGFGGGYRLPVARNFMQLSVFYEHTKDNDRSYFGWVTYRLAYGLNLAKKTSGQK